MRRVLLPALSLAFLLACSGEDPSSPKEPPRDPTADFPSAADLNARLGRGINLGNALDAPEEGAWGVTLKEEYFRRIADSGFQTVRLPVRWSAHALEEEPYTLDSAFTARVAWAVDQALARGLKVVLDMHHYDALMIDPDGERPRFLALWKQVADRFADYPAELLFELLNEPRDRLDAEAWNRLVAEAIGVIRATQAKRVLVAGTSPWGSLEGLGRLVLPEDPGLLVTVHYYDPHAFTHQGASFDSAFTHKTGVTWRATPAQRALVDQHVRRIADWSREKGRPVFIGEFGTYQRADSVSRALYTEYVAAAFSKAGFSWALWNFSSDFGLVDDSTGAWRDYLGAALLRPGSNPMLDSILASDTPIDLGRYVVWEDFEDSLPLLPASAAGWQARQGRPADSSRAAWYAFYSDSARLLLPDGSRLLRYNEVGTGKEPPNFPAAIGPWGYDGKGLHLKAVLKGSPYPHAGFGAGILGGWDSTYTDLTRLTAIQFRAKGRGEWTLQVISDSVYFGYPKADNWGQMCATFTPGPEWQDFVIPASTLAPKAWSKQAAEGLEWEDVRDRIIALEFMNGQSYGLAPDDSLEIWLDDIRLIGVERKDLGLE